MGKWRKPDLAIYFGVNFTKTCSYPNALTNDENGTTSHLLWPMQREEIIRQPAHGYGRDGRERDLLDRAEGDGVKKMNGFVCVIKGQWEMLLRFDRRDSMICVCERTSEDKHHLDHAHVGSDVGDDAGEFDGAIVCGVNYRCLEEIRRIKMCDGISEAYTECAVRDNLGESCNHIGKGSHTILLKELKNGRIATDCAMVAAEAVKQGIRIARAKK